MRFRFDIQKTIAFLYSYYGNNYNNIGHTVLRPYIPLLREINSCRRRFRRTRIRMGCSILNSHLGPNGDNHPHPDTHRHPKAAPGLDQGHNTTGGPQSIHPYSHSCDSLTVLIVPCPYCS